MNRFAISTPMGTSDRLFAGGKELRDCEQKVRKVLTGLGYQEAVTPSVEYYDVFLQAASPLDQEEMLKLVDDNGRIIVLRPDSTTPLARAAATRLKQQEPPLRMCYVQNVLRGHTGNGHPREIYQVGAELMGPSGVLADLDILIAACEVLEASGEEEYRIELSHAGIYQALITRLGVPVDTQEAIRDLIERKAFAALGDLLKPYADNEAYQALRAMPMLFGAGKDVLATAAELTGDPAVQDCLSYLEKIYDGLCQAGYGDHLAFDLGMVHEMDYYTGVVFRGYLSGAGATALTGGRYDTLCSKFGRDLPAVGFAADLDGMCNGDNREFPAVKTMVYAVPKNLARAMAYLGSHEEAVLSYQENRDDAMQEAADKGCTALVDFSDENGAVYEVTK